MNKSNLLTLLLLLLTVVCVFLFAFFANHDQADIPDDSLLESSVPEDFDTQPSEQETSLPEETGATSDDTQTTPGNTETEPPEVETKPPVVETQPPETKPQETKPQETKPTTKPSTTTPTLPEDPDIEPASLADALFIGDSRTVGIREYGGVDADFFCKESLSTFTVMSKELSVDGVGKVTLEKLLQKKQYNKIYIMLGVNEMYKSVDQIFEKYKEVVAFVQKYQPNAYLILEANLHFSQNWVNKKPTYSNDKLNQINEQIADLADGITIFYIDVNTIFDDENGCLSAGVTGDGAHLYGKYYKMWGEWIQQETARILP